MDIEERIEAAIERITCGFAPMRVPADGTDPDLVLADCLTEIRRLRAVAGPHIPEGYVLVPVEPTEAMLEAGGDVEQINLEWGVDPYVENTADVWRAMLAARPEATNVND